jgi:hypothetical protein
MQKNTRGKIRVGRYDYKNKIEPRTEGYANILIHVKDKLSPYVLKDSRGMIMENKWQFSKVYEYVNEQKQTLHKYTTKPGWTHPAEKHFDRKTKQLTEEYWKWRLKGRKCEFPVRYPNGFYGKSKCIFVLHVDGEDDGNMDKDKDKDKEFKSLGIVEGRVRVYFHEYVKMARLDPFYVELKKMLDSGVNLQINEVDGPPISCMEAPFDKVVNGSIEITKEVAVAWLKQRKYSFGHGISLAIALLDGDSWLYDMI